MKKTFAIVTALALVGFGGAALAAEEVMINTASEAVVSNVVAVTATTGGNVAMGAPAVNTVTNGSVNSSDDGNTAGNGGNHAMGGTAVIATGDAVASVGIENLINSNSADIAGDETEDVTFDTWGTITLSNVAALTAGTGANVALGASADNDVSGGEVNTSDDDNTAGNGGNHAEGGHSVVATGDALSVAAIVNIVNSNIVRIR